MLWLTTGHGIAALDVSDPRQPQVLLDALRSSRMDHVGDIVRYKDTVLLAVEREILVVDGHRPWPPRHRLPLHFDPNRIAVSGDTLWVATQSTGSTHLGAYPLVGEFWGMEITYHELPFSIGPMVGVGPLLAMLVNSVGRPTDVLRVINASDPFDLRTLGELDVGVSMAGSGLLGPPAGNLVAFGQGLALAHHETGTLLVDLRVPSQPDEVARLALPGGAEAVAGEGAVDGVAGEGMWVGSATTGLFAARWSVGADGRLDHRLWLPWLGDD